MPFIISKSVQNKLLEKHGVTRDEVIQCFANMRCLTDTLIDDREDHKTDPPTQWFIGTTDAARTLKVVYIHETPYIYIKSAYKPEPEALRIYNKNFPP